MRKTKNKERVRKATPEVPATTEPTVEEVKPTYTVFLDGYSLDLDTIMILGECFGL